MICSNGSLSLTGGGGWCRGVHKVLKVLGGTNGKGPQICIKDELLTSNLLILIIFTLIGSNLQIFLKCPLIFHQSIKRKSPFRLNTFSCSLDGAWYETYSYTIIDSFLQDLWVAAPYLDDDDNRVMIDCFEWRLGRDEIFLETAQDGANAAVLCGIYY